MILINSPINCGKLEIYFNENSGKIEDIESNYKCVVPDIIKNILNEHEIDEVKDVVQSLYCKKSESNLYYGTCGRAVMRELSKLTFK